MRFISELSKQVKFMKDDINHMRQSISERDFLIAELKASHRHLRRDEGVQVNEVDSVLAYSYKAKKLERQNEELVREILEAKKQLGSAELQLQVECTRLQQSKVDVELRNSILGEECKRVSGELAKLEVVLRINC